MQQFFCSHKHKTAKEDFSLTIKIIMGNKTAKFKKMFEEIDTGGDGCVSFHELGEFLATDRASAILGPIFVQNPLTYLTHAETIFLLLRKPKTRKKIVLLFRKKMCQSTIFGSSRISFHLLKFNFSK